MIEVAAISFFLLALGVPFLGIGVYLLLRSRKLLRYGVRTQGTVTRLIEAVDDGQDSPMVSFAPASGAGAGAVVTFRVKLADGSLNLGDVVPVLYDPKDPKRAIIAESKHLWAGPLLMGGVGVMLCLSAVAASVVSFVLESP
jgi:hypothetical protein